MAVAVVMGSTAPYRDEESNESSGKYLSTVMRFAESFAAPYVGTLCSLTILVTPLHGLFVQMRARICEHVLRVESRSRVRE